MLDNKLPSKQYTVVGQHSRLPSDKRDANQAIDDQYKHYKDKQETQDKLRIVNEEFIDDIIRRRE